MNVFKPIAREYGAEMASIHEVKLAVVAIFLEVVGELVVVDTTLSMDPVKERLDFSIDTRSDIEPTPMVSCIDTKTAALMIQEFCEFQVYLTTSANQADRGSGERRGCLPHRDVETLGWPVVTILMMHQETVARGEKDIEASLPIGSENSHGLRESVPQYPREPGNSKMRIGSTPGGSRADFKQRDLVLT
jgi:hypothetical protein